MESGPLDDIHVVPNGMLQRVRRVTRTGKRTGVFRKLTRLKTGSCVNGVYFGHFSCIIDGFFKKTVFRR